MLPTKLYHQRKTGKGSGTSNVMCRKCGTSPESVPHVLAGCGTIAQTNISRGTTQLLRSCSLRCWRTRNLFQNCLHGIQRPNPNRCMRMGVRKHYGMYSLRKHQFLLRSTPLGAGYGLTGLCREHWGEGQQNRRQNSQQRAKTSVRHVNKLSLVG